jgi:hypothetical protein
MRRIQLLVLRLALRWVERTLTKNTGVPTIIRIQKVEQWSNKKRKRRVWYLRKLMWPRVAA